MKVLMIEDNIYKEVELRRALIDMKITEIHVAEDRDTALSFLQKENFDLILLDMFFPEHRGGWEEPWMGFQILDWLVANEKKIPVICTSTVRTNLMGYDYAVGQVLYLQDDTAFRLKELIDQIPYLFGEEA